MSSPVIDFESLQLQVGKLPGPRDLKVIDYLDDHALRWLAASPFLFATFGDGDGIEVTAGAGESGFLRVDDPQHIRLATTLLDDPAIAREGRSFGSLFLVPGMDETLRINGRVRDVLGRLHRHRSGRVLLTLRQGVHALAVLGRRAER